MKVITIKINRILKRRVKNEKKLFYNTWII